MILKAEGGRKRENGDFEELTLQNLEEHPKQEVLKKQSATPVEQGGDEEEMRAGV